MTKNYEDKIAQGELEKLGVKKKENNLFDISSGQNGIWDITSDVEPQTGTMFPEVDNKPTWQSKLAKKFDDDLTDIPPHLDVRNDKWIDDIIDEQAVINHKQLDKIVDDVVKTLGDYLESKQMIYATGKAPNKLRKIIKTFITTQTKYKADDNYLSYHNKKAK